MPPGEPRSTEDVAHCEVNLTLLGFEVGKWTEEVRHAEPCDCDEDEETVGDRCIGNSVWFWALLRDEGGFAPSLAFRLSDDHGEQTVTSTTDAEASERGE